MAGIFFNILFCVYACSCTRPLCTMYWIHSLSRESFLHRIFIDHQVYLECIRSLEKWTTFQHTWLESFKVHEASFRHHYKSAFWTVRCANRWLNLCSIFIVVFAVISLSVRNETLNSITFPPYFIIIHVLLLWKFTVSHTEILTGSDLTPLLVSAESVVLDNLPKLSGFTRLCGENFFVSGLFTTDNHLEILQTYICKQVRFSVNSHWLSVKVC